MNQRAIHVLVVEDEVLVGIMIARKLQAAGYSVGKVAATGEEAVTRAGLELPDVVLMDISLAGDLNGIDAARLIKARHRIPIIIFSGYDDTLFAARLSDIEPVAVLRKLGPIDDIFTAIKKATGG